MLRVAVLPAALLLACAGSRPAIQQVSPLVGKPADIGAVDLVGREVRIDEPPGHVRVVDFWATWCEPCQEQLRHLDALADRFGERGLSVFAVSFDEDRSQLDAFLERHPVSVTVLWDRGGARLAERLDIQRLPTTLLVDRRGVIRHVQLGFDRSGRQRLEQEITNLLEEAPPDR